MPNNEKSVECFQKRKGVNFRTLFAKVLFPPPVHAPFIQVKHKMIYRICPYVKTGYILISCFCFRFRD